jgi:hypothetical protein
MLRKTLVLMALAAFAAAGCAWTQSATSRTPPAAPPPPTTIKPADEDVFYQRAKPVDPPLPTAVETTLALQDKYTRSLEDLQRERDRTRDLTEEKRKLDDAGNKHQADLAKAQLELNDANALLMQMRQELEKWKTDVMGFRDEMRQASQTQLDALAKVMNLLGAETAATATPATAKTPAAAENPPLAPAPAAPAPGPAAPVGAKTVIQPARPATPAAAKPPAASPQASIGAKKDIARASSN